MRDIQLGDTLRHAFTTRQFSDGVPTTLSGSPVLSVLEEDNGTPITAGVSVSTDRASVAGLNEATIIATSGNGYEVGKAYAIYISTGTVGGVSVVGEVVGNFTVQASAAAQDLANGIDGLGVIKAETALIKTEADKIALVDAGAGVAGSVVEEVENRVTPAELNARTILAADYFDAAADAVANVTLVATTSVNTDAFSSSEKDQIRDALGVDGAKTAAAGGQIQTIDGNVDTINTATGGLAGAAMRGTDAGALATVCTPTRLAELDPANLPADIAAIDTAPMRGTDGVDPAPMRGTDAGALASVCTAARLSELDDVAGKLVFVADAIEIIVTPITEARLSELDDDVGKLVRIADTILSRQSSAANKFRGITPLDTGFSGGLAPSSTEFLRKPTPPMGADDVLNGATLNIIDGPGEGQTRRIIDFDDGTDILTIEPPWDVLPDVLSVYEVVGVPSVAMRGTDGVDTAPMRGTDGVTGFALASIATEARLAKLDPANILVDIRAMNGNTAAAVTQAIGIGQIIRGTVDHTVFVATTTELEVDDITDAAPEHYGGRRILFTSGVLFGQETSISAYALVGGRGHFTYNAVTSAPGDDVTLIVI